MSKTKVMIAMSGGVDSTMAASLLVDQGYDVVGGTLSLADSNKCCLLFEAKSTCQDLGIPHYTFDAKERFREQIIDYYLSEIKIGRTPSPCVHCNAFLKFGWLLDKARELGCEYIATGHYSQIIERDGRYLIKKGTDLTKDQAYFLFELSQDQLKHTIFPLGHLTKAEVREHCREKQFPSAEQSDSQDLCFVPREGPQPFIREQCPDLVRKGNIIDVDGNILGEHEGVYQYTIGQRKGLGLHGGPWYVTELRPNTDEVIVGRKDDVTASTMELANVNWLIYPPKEPLECRVRIRYNHREALATVYPDGETAARVEFVEPQFAITPGQAAAFFDEDAVIGGGWIL